MNGTSLDRFESLRLDRFLYETRRSCFHRNSERKGRYCIYTISKKNKTPHNNHAWLACNKKLNVKQTTLSKIHSTAFFTKKKTNLFDGGWIWTFLAANLYTKHQSQQKGPHPQALSQRRRAIEPRATAMSASFHPASWELKEIKESGGQQKNDLEKEWHLLMFGVLEHWSRWSQSAWVFFLSKVSNIQVKSIGEVNHLTNLQNFRNPLISFSLSFPYHMADMMLYMRHSCLINIFTSEQGWSSSFMTKCVPFACHQA